MSDTIFLCRKLIETSKSNNSNTKANQQKLTSDLETALKNKPIKKNVKKRCR